jgi:DNA-directed RNA polymerase specialized sigma24 family protein
LAYTKLMSPAAISAELGLRRTVVKSRLYRIRKKLRLRVSQALEQSWV